MSRALASLLLVLPLVAAGCSGAPEVPYDPATLALAEAEEDALRGSFRDASLPFEGFAAVEPGADWRVGDEILFGVEYRSGEERERWVIGLRVASLPFGRGRPLVHVEREAPNGEKYPEGKELVQIYIGAEFTLSLTDDAGTEWTFDSDSILIAASTYDLAGKRIERETSIVPADFLAAGFHDACTRFGDFFATKAQFTTLPSEEAAPIRRAYAESFAALLTLFRTLEKNQAMAGILWKVVEKPSIFSVMFRRGVEVSLAARFEQVEKETRRSDAVPPEIALLRLPVDIEVNDNTALHATLSVAPSDCPVRTVAGVIAIDGRHPRDPERVVRVRLLATRRGPERPPEPAPEPGLEGIIPLPTAEPAAGG